MCQQHGGMTRGAAGLGVHADAASVGWYNPQMPGSRASSLLSSSPCHVNHVRQSMDPYMLPLALPHTPLFMWLTSATKMYPGNMLPLEVPAA